MSRIAITCLFTLALGCVSTGQDGQRPASSTPRGQQPQRRPNIIIFVTDDQSPFRSKVPRPNVARAFGFCGERRVHTPQIDRLAGEGIVFTRAYVSSSVCCPSRYSTLTGRYAGRCSGRSFASLHPQGALTRVENNTELEDDRLNLAKVLKANGYRTGMVGKSHLVDHHLLNGPRSWESHGLKHYRAEDDPRDPEITARMKHNHEAWCERSRRHGFDFVGGLYPANLRELHNQSARVHNVEWTTHAAIEFIKSSSDQPFFLYYSTTAPHGPAPWIKNGGKFVHGLDADPRMTGEGWVDKDYSFMPSREAIKRLAKANGVAPRDAWLVWLDCAIGAIRRQLEAQGMLENTLFVITSDHGAWRHGKTTLHEGGLRVPLAIHWPRVIKPGSTYGELVQNVDFAPTILEAAGIPAPAAMQLDGLSLGAVFKGAKEPLRDHLFAELGFSRGVITMDWKYLAIRYDEKTRRDLARSRTFRGYKGERLRLPYLTRNGHLGYHAARHNPHYFAADQLYNLGADPYEEVNLAGARPQQLGVMRALLKSSLAGFHKRPFGEFTK